MIDIKSIPDALKEGENWQLLDLDLDWMWVVHENDEIVGFLLAANCHGIVHVMRVKMLPTAKSTSLLRLFRNFIRDLKARGCLGYMAWIDIAQEKFAPALTRIAYRAGAHLLPFTGIVVAGSAEAKHCHL